MQALSLRQLAKTYATGVQALKGIDLDVEQGDFFALLGPNGAGKTTLIGIVTSLVNKTSRQALVFGHDIDTELEAAKACSAWCRRKSTSTCSRRSRHPASTRPASTASRARVAKERMEKWLQPAQLWDKRDAMSRTLSGGMKRRLMIARAMMPRAAPADPRRAHRRRRHRDPPLMWEFLRQLNAAGTTIILTTHYLEEAESLCRNIAIIDDGRIIEQRPHGDGAAQARRRGVRAEPAPAGRRRAGAAGLRASSSPTTTTLEVEMPRAEPQRHLRRADRRRHRGRSMRTKTNRLEELFVRLVEGRDAETGLAKPAVPA